MATCENIKGQNDGNEGVDMAAVVFLDECVRQLRDS